MKKVNRILALFLALVLVIGVLPMSVFAEELQTAEPTVNTETATEPTPTDPVAETAAETTPETTLETTTATTEATEAAAADMEATDATETLEVTEMTVPTETADITEATDPTEPIQDEQSVTIPALAQNVLDLPSLQASRTTDTLWILGEYQISADPRLEFGNNYYYGIRKMYFGSYSNPTYAYCIKPSIETDSNTDYYTDESASRTAWEALGTVKQQAITLTMAYGFPTNFAKALPNSSDGWVQAAQYAATQVIIWEFTEGCRDASTRKRTSTRIVNSFSDNSTFMSAYNTISSLLENHNKIPSFMKSYSGSAPTIELKPDGKGNYVASVTDTNKVLANWTMPSVSGITFSKSGNTLTITATAGAAKELSNSKVCASTNPNMPNQEADSVLTWASASTYNTYQPVVTFLKSRQDPVPAYFKLHAQATGHAAVAKTSEDSKVAGITFQLKQDSTVLETKQTDSNGKITFTTDLLDGTKYTIHEVAPAGYTAQADKEITAVANQTVTASFRNVLEKGSLKVTKTAEDRLVQGVKFHLSGTSLTGQVVDLYAVTNDDGVAVFSDVPVGTGYTLEEVDTATRYVVPQAQTVEIKWNEVTETSVSNVLKKWTATITKADHETGYAQGDGTLTGAIYGIYNGEALVDTYTTDAAGRITTKEYLCGNAWTIREISPSEGYLLDPTVYSVGAEAGNFTIEHNTLSVDVKETAIKGRISILKIAGGNGQSGIQTPENGAEFQIWRTAAGSYDAARDTEKDILTTDRNGFGQTKYLPYGTYTVHQSKGWAETVFVEDFQVAISADGETYHYTLNNAWKTIRIQAVKIDRETGNVIPVAGVGFQFFDAKGNKLIYEVTYPTPAVIDTYYTGEDGTLVTPWELKHGTYTAVEVVAPAGYVLDSTPVTFKVSDDSATTTVGGLKVMRVEISDLPQMGRIEIAKTGEGLVSVIEADGIYTPVWGKTGVAGATFEIRAAEEITTLDGTLRYHAGDLVDTVVTGADGKAVSKALYLGPYTITETVAPAGYVLDTTSHAAELTYAGQNIEITSTQIGLHNDRQKAAVSLIKSMEQDTTYGLGANGEIQNVVFGLYAAEEITALDGSVIPAGGKLDTVTVAADGTAAFAVDLPLGSYYVQEISTDEHYILDNTKYPLIFRNDTKVAVADLAVNNGEAIDNDLIRGRIHGYKLGENEESLAGATFGLFPAGTTEYSAKTVLALAVSDETGEFVFENVPFGKYEIKELEAPIAHVADDRIYEVEISDDAQIIGINVPNDLIRGAVQLTKVDKNYPKNKLTGAKFVVYRDLNGNGGLDEDELETAMVLPEIGDGVYRLESLEWGQYLVQETEAPDGYYLDDGIYSFEIVTDGETVIVENEAGTGCFVNQHVPELHTTASVDGEKEAHFGGKITVKDTVSYKYLIVGKTYTVSGKLMDKSTGLLFLVNGKEITAEATFTAEKSEGTIELEFTFDSSSLIVKTELVVFETLYADGSEVGAHADLTDVGQTVTLTPQPKVPHTGNNDLLFFGGIAILGVLFLATGIVLLARKRKIQ